MNDNAMVSVPRSVLEKIQWWWGVKTLRKFCPICKAGSQNGHKEDCPIGKALKVANVEEKVIPQHEIEIKGQKYVTELGKGKGSSCDGCCFVMCSGECVVSERVTTWPDLREFCFQEGNPDGLNRIWVKAEK